MTRLQLNYFQPTCVRQILSKLWWCYVLGAVSIGITTDASAQPLPENPVYINDSPQAWELFQLAQDQVADNAGEAVRLYQELLDEYSAKLLPINTLTDDHYIAVRPRVLIELLSNQQLLERYRLIETAQAQRMLDLGQLLQLAITRSVTAPGLEALLQLAQGDTEAARFQSALNWLDEAKNHPDLDEEKAQHCWFMIALAAHCVGETDLKNHAVETLSFIEGSRKQLGDSLKRMIDSISSLPQQRAISPLIRGEAVELRELVSQPIWSTNLSTTPYSQRVLTSGTNFELPSGPFRQSRQPSVELTTAPTIKGNAVYVNEGRTVRALDRFTGRSLWRKPYVERMRKLSQSRPSTKIVDMNIVAVDSGSLVTITGHTLTNSRNPEEADRTIVCLDERTGKLRWAIKIDRIQGNEDFSGLIPHGAPIIAEGAVFVLARKISRQLLTSCYLVSLDLADGKLRWARHIASSGGIRSRAARPYSSPIYHKGDLIIATPIGAVTRVQCDTGETKWLRRYAPPLNPVSPIERKAWQIGQPAVTSNGVIALSPNEQHVLLLDWDTGDELQRISAKGRDAWNAPRYFLADEEKVYAIGREVRVFNVDALEKPVWGVPRPVLLSTNLDIPMPESLEIFGRVQLTDGALIIPTHDEFLVVEVQRGQISQIVAANVGGNPLAVGSQLIVAGNQQLDSYMPLRRAEEMLRQRIAQTPDVPGPALSLLQLGIRAKNLDLALEAAELVVNATNVLPITQESQSARQELLSMLLEINRQGIAATNQQGEMLHAMIGSVAIEPQQRVEYLLAYGDWLSTQSLAKAVAAYQTILSAQELADTPRFEDSVLRPASAWATQRLGDLAHDRGLNIYRPQSVFAGMRLDQLIDSEASTQQYLALAREFPLSDASAHASLLAANLINTGENHLDVVVLLINAYRLDPSEQRARKLLGSVIARCEIAGWNNSAENVLQFVIDSFGSVVLDSPTGPRDAQKWLASLRRSNETQLPQIGALQGDIKKLQGRVVTAFPDLKITLPNDRVLLHDGSHFHLSAALGLETIWSIPFEQRVHPYILRFTDEQLLLWLVAPGGDARAMMLNPSRNGAVLWNTPWMSQILGDPPLGRRRDSEEAQRQGIEFSPILCQPLLSGQTLTVVRHAGEMVSFDISNEGQLRWEKVINLPLDRVDFVMQHDFAIAISGTRRNLGNEESIGRLILVDPETGKIISDIKTLDAQPLRWMNIGPLGDLVYGSTAGIQALEISSGQSRWSNISDAAKSVTEGWPIGEKVIIETPLDRLSQRISPLRSIDIQSGDISQEFALPGRGGWDANDLNDILISQGHIYAIFSERIVRYDDSGTVDGADSVFGVPEERNYKWLLPADDRLVLVSLFQSRQANGAPGRGRQRQLTYRLYTLSDNCKLIGETVQPPSVLRRYDHARIIDGWVLLSTATSTDAIAAPTNN